MAMGCLGAAITRRPPVRAPIEGCDRRLGENRVGVARATGVLTGSVATGYARACSHAIATTVDKRIGQQAHEQVHRIKRGLLRSDRGLARNLRETRRGQAAERQGNAAVAGEESGDRIGNALPVAAKAAAWGSDEAQREIEV